MLNLNNLPSKCMELLVLIDAIMDWIGIEILKGKFN